MPIKRRQPGVEPYDRKWLEAVHTTPKYNKILLGQNLEKIAQRQEQRKKEQKEAEAEARAKGKDGKPSAGSKGAGKNGEIEKILEEGKGEGESESPDGKASSPFTGNHNPMGRTDIPERIAYIREHRQRQCGFDERFLKDDTYLGNFKLVGDAPHVRLPDTVPYYKKKIAAAMIDNQFDREIRNQRRGNLDYSALYKAKTGSDRVFKKKEEPKNKKYAIGFLYDKSGSMHGSKSAGVVKTIYTIHEMIYSLQGMRVYEAYFDTDFRLLSHPDWRRSGYEVAAKYAMMMESPGHPAGGYDPGDEYDMPERLAEVKNRLTAYYNAEIHDFETDMLAYDGENNDGEAIERMLGWMSHEDETVGNKILFVVGDGQVGEDTQEYIREKLIPEAKQKYNITVVGISIGETDMREIYPDLMVVRSDGSDLPEVLASTIASLIKRG